MPSRTTRGGRQAANGNGVYPRGRALRNGKRRGGGGCRVTFASPSESHAQTGEWGRMERTDRMDGMNRMGGGGAGWRWLPGPVCHARRRDVRCRHPLPRPCPRRKVTGTARPGATPAICPSTGGRLAREAVHGAFMSHTPCVGCGWCCLSDQCQVSHHLHGYLPRCPELVWDAALERYLCLLMAPGRASSGPGPDLTELRQGLGCCAPLCSWRREVRDRG